MIQKKETVAFDVYLLTDVETAFCQMELVSFDERKRLRLNDTELIVSAVASGHSLGGAAWKIEFNKLMINYAL